MIWEQDFGQYKSSFWYFACIESYAINLFFFNCAYPGPVLDISIYKTQLLLL